MCHVTKGVVSMRAGWCRRYVMCLAACMGLCFPAMVKAAEEGVLANLLEGMRAYRQSISSGEVHYDYVSTRYPDKRFATPEGFEKEVNRHVAAKARRYQELAGRTGDRAEVPRQQVAQWRREAEQLVRQLSVKRRWEKKGVFIWSGARMRVDIGDKTKQFDPDARYDLAVRVAAFDGSLWRMYGNTQPNSISGSIGSEKNRVSEKAQRHPLRWIVDWPALDPDQREMLALTGSERREGHEMFWVTHEEKGESVLVCPDWAYVVVEKRKLRDNGQVAQVTIAGDIRKIDGVFFPMEFESTTYLPDEEPYAKSSRTVTSASFNQPVEEAVFAPTFPPGTHVTDFTFVPPLTHEIPGPPQMVGNTLLPIKERGQSEPAPSGSSAAKPMPALEDMEPIPHATGGVDESRTREAEANAASPDSHHGSPSDVTEGAGLLLVAIVGLASLSMCVCFVLFVKKKKTQHL